MTTDTRFDIGRGLHIINKPDYLDAQQILDMQLSEAWKVYERKLDGMIDMEKLSLEHATSETLSRVQGRLEILRRVKALPDILRQEIARGGKSS